MMTAMTSISEANESELFGLMAAQHCDPATANAAWVELRERHVEYLYRRVRNAYGRHFHYNEDDLENIVEDTFRRAFDWAGKQPNPQGLSEQFCPKDPAVSRRIFKKWLGTTAQRFALDKIRQSSTSIEDINRFHEILHAPSSAEQLSSLTPIIECLKRILTNLSHRDREALRACLPWYNIETGRFALPPGEAARIALDIGMNNPDTLRQRRHRALAYIRAQLIAEGFFPASKGDAV